MPRSCQILTVPSLEAEAKKLADQEQVIVKIWKSRGGVKKIREAAKEMQNQVDRMKAMVK